MINTLTGCSEATNFPLFMMMTSLRRHVIGFSSFVEHNIYYQPVKLRFDALHHHCIIFCETVHILFLEIIYLLFRLCPIILE